MVGPADTLVLLFSSLLSGRISTLRDETGAVSMAFIASKKPGQNVQATFVHPSKSFQLMKHVQLSHRTQQLYELIINE